MKAYLILALLFTTSAFAGIAVTPTERIMTKLRIHCKDSQWETRVTNLRVYVANEEEPFFVQDPVRDDEVFEVLNNEDFHVKHDGESVRVGVLSNPLPLECQEDSWDYHESEVVLDSRFSFGLNTKHIENSCRAKGGIADFDGYYRRVVFSDLLLINNDTEEGTKIAYMLFFTEKDSCQNLKTIGSGILSIIFSPILIFLRGC